MTLDETIERLAIIEELMATDYSPEDANAVKLGIEALKRIRDHRGEVYFRYDLPLPGETEEVK